MRLSDGLIEHPMQSGRRSGATATLAKAESMTNPSGASTTVRVRSAAWERLRTRGRHAGAKLVLGVALLAGCGSTARSRPEPSPGGCNTDADCGSGFCDRTGQCSSVDVDSTARFGTPCTIAPRNPNGTVNGEQNTCGPYLCVEGRCRSCVEDSECQIEYGAPSCGHVSEARWPGNSCGNYSSANASAPIRRSGKPIAAANAPKRITVEVVATHPHSSQAYTEGLVFHQGEVWESTGNTGESRLRRTVLLSGAETAAVPLEDELFGEGLARQGDRLVQLTLSSERALLWDVETLERVGELPYQGEGWGLCHDGRQFVMSNGTSTLQLRDSETFALLREVAVRPSPAAPFRFLRLNELECVGGDVIANVFEYRELVRIDLASGEIAAVIDTRSLLRHPDVPSDALDKALDLNGIAYVPETEHYLLTGKYWPLVFEVRLVDDPLFR